MGKGPCSEPHLALSSELGECPHREAAALGRVGGHAGHTESTCIVSPRDSDLLVGIREPAWRAVTDRPPGMASVSEPCAPLPSRAPQGPLAFCMCALGLSEVSSVPRADKPAASPAAPWSPGALQRSGRPLLPAAPPAQCSEPCLPSPLWAGLGDGELPCSSGSGSSDLLCLYRAD